MYRFDAREKEGNKNEDFDMPNNVIEPKEGRRREKEKLRSQTI